MLRAFEIQVLHCPCGAGADRYLRGTGLGTPTPLARPPPTVVLEPDTLA